MYEVIIMNHKINNKLKKNQNIVGDNIPKGWVYAQIKDLANYVNGRAFKPSEWEEKGRPIIRIQNLTGFNKNYNYFSGKIEKKYLIRDGDLLISWSATLGSYIYHGEDAILNQHIFKAEPFINKNFLHYALLNILDELKQKIHGSGIQHITKKPFENHLVLLPSMAEQKRIVDKLESIFAQIDVKQKELLDIEKQFQCISDSMLSLKNSILIQAFEGKLVSQDHNEKLLPTIQIKSKIKSYSNINKLKQKNPFGWSIYSIGDVMELSKEKFTPPSDKSFLFLGLEHIEKNTRKIISVGCSKNIRSTKNIFKSQDILYGKLRPYLNKTCVPNFDGICSTDILVFKQNKIVDSKFFALFLSTPNFVSYATKNMNGVHHPRINFKKISEYEFLLPPLEEQKRIVIKINSIFANIDAAQKELKHLEMIYKTVPDCINMLKHSILKMALEGNLIPQDPNDESAYVLLKKLKSKKLNF